MSVNKHLMRRYLLATLVGVAVGLPTNFARYESHIKGLADHPMGVQEIDRCIIDNFHSLQPGSLDSVRALFQAYFLLFFLLEDNSAGNILLGSTLLVPFAVYTFDVVAASRRKRIEGAA